MARVRRLPYQCWQIDLDYEFGVSLDDPKVRLRFAYGWLIADHQKWALPRLRLHINALWRITHVQDSSGDFTLTPFEGIDLVRAQRLVDLVLPDARRFFRQKANRSRRVYKFSLGEVVGKLDFEPDADDNVVDDDVLVAI